MSKFIYKPCQSPVSSCKVSTPLSLLLDRVCPDLRNGCLLSGFMGNELECRTNKLREYLHCSQVCPDSRLIPHELRNKRHLFLLFTMLSLKTLKFLKFLKNSYKSKFPIVLALKLTSCKSLLM